ncbi:MAG: heparinase II/III family protein [Candidatus Solibacter usitatus]|nr:heparinase II/III family protein [Candidatus Solibacter usitatus]
MRRRARLLVARGRGYWSRAGASLFDNLELLHSATEGKLSFYNVPLVKEIGRYIHRVHIAGDWFVNFADASAKAHPEGLLIRRYGEAIQDVELESFGALLAAQSTGLGTIGRSLPALFHAGRPVKSVAPLVREAWMPGTQVCTARRQAGTAEGLYFAAQGGHNAESHNHNDVGNFILFSNGDPVLIDVGVETYTAKTFSSKRYEIWTMQSAYHNCPTINGAMQAAGRQYEARDVAFHSDDAGATFSADLAAAYPAEAGVRSWLRKIHLDRRTNSLELSDTYALRTANDLAMSFITPCAAMTDGNVVTLSGGMLTKGTVRISVDAAQTPRFAVEEIDVTDRRLQGVWGNRLRRILISWQKPSANGTLRFRIT